MSVPPPPAATPPPPPEPASARTPEPRSRGVGVGVLAVLLGIPLVLLVVAAGLGFLVHRSVSGAGRAVWVIGGLPGPSEVRVGGEVVRLSGFDPDEIDPRVDVDVDGWRVSPDAEEVTLPPGTHAVELVLPDGRTLDRGAIEVPGGWGGRVFGDTVRVLNADGLIALEQIPVRYSDDESEPPPNRRVLPTLYHKLPGIDHPFEVGPEEVTIPEGADHVDRTELYPEAYGPADLIWTLEADGEEEAAERYAVAALSLLPDDAAVLREALEVLEAEDRPRLESLLVERPLRVGPHRMWQDIVAWERGPGAVVEEYAALLEAEGESATLLTLAARRCEDPTRHRAWIARALELEPDHPEANAEAAELALLDGDLDAALVHASKRPAGEWAGRRDSVLWMRNRWSELRERLPDDPAEVQTLEEAHQLATLEALLHGEAAGRSAASAAVRSFGFDAPADEEAALAAAEAAAAYATGNPGPLAERLAAEGGVSAAMRLGLLRGDAAAVGSALAAAAAEDAEPLPLARLLEAAALLTASGSSAADGPLRAAAAGDPWRERLVAWALDAEGPPLPLPVVSWRAEEGMVAAAVLRAARDPAARPELLPRIDRWNADPREPHLSLGKVVDGLR